MYLDELLHHHYAPISGLLPGTIERYHFSLLLFDRWLAKRPDREPGKGTLADFSDATIAQFVSDREREVRRVTARRDGSQLECLWRHACRAGLLTTWPRGARTSRPGRKPTAVKPKAVDEKGDATRDPSQTTLRDFFDNLYRPLRLRGKSPKTVLLYHCLFRTFGRFLGRDATLTDLDELVLARYLEHRITKVAPLTVEHERQQLMAVSGLAWERRLLEVKPTCPPGLIPERAPVAWSIEQMAHLMAVAGDRKTYQRLADFYTRLFPAMISVIWETGERIGAIRDVDRADFMRPHLLVRSELRKGRKRDRVYNLSPATCDRLDALPPSENGKLFYWPFSVTFLQIGFRRVIKKAGLNVEGKKRMLFHQIRRTALTHYQAAGGNACEMADHSSDKITKRWYLDPRITDKGQKPCDVLPSLESKADPRLYSNAVLAGVEAGKAHALAGLSRPSPEEVAAMAVAAGHSNFAAAFRNGFMSWFGDGAQREAG